MNNIIKISNLDIILFKVDVMLRKVNHDGVSIQLDKLQPMVMLKTCPKPPCAMCKTCVPKKPCVRLCTVFSNRPSYPHIDSSNIEACHGDKNSHNCSAINAKVAQTLFGNTTGKIKWYMHIYIPDV